MDWIDMVNSQMADTAIWLELCGFTVVYSHGEIVAENERVPLTISVNACGMELVGKYTSSLEIFPLRVNILDVVQDRVQLWVGLGKTDKAVADAHYWAVRRYEYK